MVLKRGRYTSHFRPLSSSKKTGAPQKKSFIKFQSRNKATSPEFMTDNRVFVAKDN